MQPKKTINYKTLFATYANILLKSLVPCVVLFYFGKLVLKGFSDEIHTPNFQSLSIANIIISPIFFTILGTIVFVLLVLFTKNPQRNLRIAGYGFYLFMLPGPLGLENATTMDRLLLEIMHTIVAILFVETMIKAYPKIVAETNTEIESKKTSM